MEAKLSFSGTAELPPKKRVIDREKSFPNEPTSLSLGKGKGKSLLDQETYQSNHFKPEKNPQNEGEMGESSRLETSPPRNHIVCKFCGQKFSSTQALGGHQNAHKQEREIQKAMKEANKHGRSYPYNNHPPPTSPAFHGSYHGYPHQSPFNQSYPNSGWHPRPIIPSPNARPRMCPPGLLRTYQGFSGPSAWARPIIHSPGSVKRPREPANVDSNASPTPSFGALLQKWQNESAIAKMQCNEPTMANTSLNNIGSETVDFLLKMNESGEGIQQHKKTTELDLTLKL